MFRFAPSCKFFGSNRYFLAKRKFSNNRGNVQGEWLFVLARIGFRAAGYAAGKGVESAVKTGNTKIITWGIGGVLMVGGLAYVSVSDSIPYSNRRRVVYMSLQEEADLSSEALEQVLAREGPNMLPSDSADVQIVSRIAENVLRVCRSDGVVARHMQFTVHVINSPVTNAFVLPNGHIFVYTGILPIAETEAGLAAIIGHEVTHALARHSAEKIANFKMLILFYEFLRGFGEAKETQPLRATLFEFLAVTVLQVVLPLAYSRQMELEADRVGTLLVAKAGYDPRHAAKVWRRMISYEESLDNHGVNSSSSGDGALSAQLMTDSLQVKTRLKEIMSTHPSHQRRVEELDSYALELMPEYEVAISRMEMAGLAIPDSDRILFSRKKFPLAANNINGDGDREDPDGFVFRNEDVYDYDENSLLSAALASKCSALMVGRPYEENMWKIVEELRLK